MPVAKDKKISSDQEDPDGPMSSSAILNSITCVGMQVWGGGIRGRGGANGLWDMWELILSVGPEWREVCTLALKATVPSKGFFAFENPTC